MYNNRSSIQIIASPGFAAFYYKPLIIFSVSRQSCIFQVKILCIYFKDCQIGLHRLRIQNKIVC